MYIHVPQTSVKAACMSTANLMWWQAIGYKVAHGRVDVLELGSDKILMGVQANAIFVSTSRNRLIKLRNTGNERAQIRQRKTEEK